MPKLSIKHMQIEKANHAVILAASIGVAVVVFGLFGGRAILSKLSHIERAVAAQETAKKTLEENLVAKDELVKSYKDFADPTLLSNIIGGSINENTGVNDGDNARIILSALPSKYDFPALVTSMESVLKGYNITEIDGEDDEINQSQQESLSTSLPVEIPYELRVEDTNYNGVGNIVSVLNRSIRPISVQKMVISGGGNQMEIDLELLTYYQPSIQLTIEEEVIR